MQGICKCCGEYINSEKDKLCYGDTGHVRISMDKNGEPFQEPCGPIEWSQNAAT